MTKTLTPLAAIRARCRQCSNGMPSEIRKCTVTDCAIHPYRLGVRPETAAKKQAKKKAETLRLNF
ncbi:MAG: hypothetical protein BA869_10885 [Desulfuromonadales bacterium C00003107]|jgi:hypothetical protein|nr:MAG: hypothetical protein BA869_10885 [Desulfuromonadales bacterium C00003107]